MIDFIWGNADTPQSWFTPRRDGTGVILLVCPNGHVMGSLENHLILSGGEIMPSVICDRCDFHDYVRLLPK